MFNSITIRYVAIGFIHVLVALILSLSIKYCLKATIKNGGSIRSHLYIDISFAKRQNKSNL